MPGSIVATAWCTGNDPFPMIALCEQYTHEDRYLEGLARRQGLTTRVGARPGSVPVPCRSPMQTRLFVRQLSTPTAAE
jgi:hypothetical protein